MCHVAVATMQAIARRLVAVGSRALCKTSHSTKLPVVLICDLLLLASVFTRALWQPSILARFVCGSLIDYVVEQLLVCVQKRCIIIHLVDRGLYGCARERVVGAPGSK